MSQGATITIETRLYTDMASKSEFVGFYIPNSRDTFQICLYLIDHYKELVIDPAHKTFSMQTGSPGERMMEFKDLHFTGRIFIYHEFPLYQSDTDILVAEFQKRKLSPQFRGTDYAFSRNNPVMPPFKVPSPS